MKKFILIILTIFLTILSLITAKNDVFAIAYVCEAYNGDVCVGEYSEFEDALEALNGTNSDGIDRIVLLDDVSYATNGKNLLNIKKSVTIDGQNHTISGYGNRSGNCTTLAINNEGNEVIDVILKNLSINNGAAGGRAIETRGNINSFTLENCSINTTGNGGWEQGITIGGNQSSIAEVNLKNTNVLVGQSGYAIIMFNPVKLTIEDSDIEGYTSLYFKSPTSSQGTFGSTAMIKNSKLGSHNYSQSSGDSFSTLTFEDAGIEVNIYDCDIETGSENSGANSFASLQYLFYDYNYKIGGTGYYNTYDSVQEKIYNKSIVTDNPIKIKIYGDNTKIGFNGTSWEFTTLYDWCDSIADCGVEVSCTGGIYTINPASATMRTNYDYEEENMNYVMFDNVDYKNYVCDGYISIPNTDETTNTKYPYRIVKISKKDENDDTENLNLQANQVANKEVKKENSILDEQVTDKDLINIRASSTELLPEAMEIVKSDKVVNEANNNGYNGIDGDVIVVNTYFDIKLQSVEEADNSTDEKVVLDKVVMDIVPKYSAYIYGSNNVFKKILYSDLELGIPIERTVKLRVYLPDNFVVDIDTDRVWVKHWISEKESKVYGGAEGLAICQDTDVNSLTYKAYYVEFDNPDDFSVFEFTRYSVNPDTPTQDESESELEQVSQQSETSYVNEYHVVKTCIY